MQCLSLYVDDVSDIVLGGLMPTVEVTLRIVDTYKTCGRSYRAVILLTVRTLSMITDDGSSKGYTHKRSSNPHSTSFAYPEGVIGWFLSTPGIQ